MKGLAALATVIILLQLVFSLYQVNYYNRFLKNLAQKYSDSVGYSLDTEVSKNMLSSAVVAIVSDEQNKIQEAYYYKGTTIFSKFKRIEQLENRNLDQTLFDEIATSKKTLMTKALSKLIEKKASR